MSDLVVLVELSCGHLSAALRIHGRPVTGWRHCGQCSAPAEVVADLGPKEEKR